MSAARLAVVFSAAPIVRGLQHQPMLKIGRHRDKGDERTEFVPDLWAVGPLSQSLAKACSWKRKRSPHRSFDSRQLLPDTNRTSPEDCCGTLPEAISRLWI